MYWTPRARKPPAALKATIRTAPWATARAAITARVIVVLPEPEWVPAMIKVSDTVSREPRIEVTLWPVTRESPRLPFSASLMRPGASRWPRQ